MSYPSFECLLSSVPPLTKQYTWYMSSTGSLALYKQTVLVYEYTYTRVSIKWTTVYASTVKPMFVHIDDVVMQVLYRYTCWEFADNDVPCKLHEVFSDCFTDKYLWKKEPTLITSHDTIVMCLHTALSHQSIYAWYYIIPACGCSHVLSTA